MMVYGMEWYAHGPGLKGVAIHTETIVARQRDEIACLPRPVTEFHPAHDGLCLLLQAFCL